MVGEAQKKKRNLMMGEAQKEKSHGGESTQKRKEISRWGSTKKNLMVGEAQKRKKEKDFQPLSERLTPFTTILIHQSDMHCEQNFSGG
jgi:hypothetical protein